MSQLTERQRITAIPKRLFQWIYSFSLVLFIILTLAFVSVTPIDVIVQTLGAQSSGIKLFIVIIVCVVFLVTLIIIYSLRVFKFKISMNDIPSKSVYIPFEGDLPQDIFEMIDRKLQECWDLRERATPLGNLKIVINNPGMSPPEYIQDRNRKIVGNGVGGGTSLPPTANYEDIIRSIGDKLISNGKALAQVDVPKYYSFREVVIYLTEVYIVNGNVAKEKIPNLDLLITLYNKFRFGPKLILEMELLEFMVEFDKLGQICQANYHVNLSSTREDQAISDFHSNFELESDGYEDYEYDSDKIRHPELFNKIRHNSNGSINDTDLNDSDYIPRNINDSESFLSVKQLHKLTDQLCRSRTNTSSRSAIRTKLALSSRQDSFLDIRRMGSQKSSIEKRYSGYDSDVSE